MSEILRDKLPDTQTYQGYCPNTIYEIRGIPMGWEEMKPLKRIPPKISYFLYNFTEVRRFPFKDEKTRNQYFVKSNSGKFFEVLY